jgi:hypothetical protein
MTDLPMQALTKYEPRLSPQDRQVAHGPTLPLPLLGRADEVIE